MEQFTSMTGWRYFPYPSFKPNQEELLKVVSSAIKQRKHAIVDGASGLGKTAGSLAGALNACKPSGLRILYAARTYKELDRVVEELQEISRKEKVTGISLRGRAEMCVNEAVLRLSRDPRTVSELCSDLVKSRKCPYHMNIEQEGRSVRYLVEEFLSSPTAAYDLISKSKDNELCPYEMTKLLLPHVEVIALSYAYLFNRDIRDAFVKRLGQSISQYVLILDEAHNLPDTVNEYESDRISVNSLIHASREADNYGKADIVRFAEALLSMIENKGFGEHVVNLQSIADDAIKSARIRDPLPIFLEEVYSFGERIKMDLLSKGKIPRSYIRRIGEFFLKAYETSEKKEFVHILHSEEGEGAKTVEIVSLDPRTATSEVLESVAASISMSGTLEEMVSYAEVMGLPADSLKVTLPSPFGREQTLVLVCKGVSTLYERRGAESYSAMVSKIEEVVSNTPGNTGVFCSSYNVMEGLIGAGLEEALAKPLYVEQQKARSVDQDRLISEFKAMGDGGGAVLLGVVGGRFSEGEDYPGNEMNTVVIVGVPYPRPTAKINAQINYYESIFPGKGREYAYTIPAMRKASQAAGRPFRNLSDRGVVVFMDYRFASPNLRRLLPSWIRDRIISVEDKKEYLGELVSRFYSGMSASEVSSSRRSTSTA
ncbi:MAG: ATP-dependent DNA helicase [Candidatus Verstraetearchaeota archaeon]|nr:ATP-dependent DNA helicase [Candidatus Verstraetearchaeota archaeon]